MRNPDAFHARLADWRESCLARRGITPLILPAFPPFLRRFGFGQRMRGGWALIRTSRPQPDVIRCEIAVGLVDGVPVWATFDEGRDRPD